MDGQTIHFHRLSFVSNGLDVVVGRPDIGSYAVLPHDGAELLRHLTEGMSARQAAEWYEVTFDEPVDMNDFLESMDDLGFVRSADTEVTAIHAPRFQRLGQALFSRPAWIAYLLLVVTCLCLLLLHSDLRPRPSMVYFTDSLVSVQLLILVGQTPLAFLHESFHVLAIQRLGLPSKLSISNRFTYVVFETQCNGLLSVHRNRRYLPFLAGMLLDLGVFCVLDLVASANRGVDGSFTLTGRICLALSFTVATRIGWQFLLYLQTDLYYVLATALNCKDLHDASTAIFFNRIRRVLGRTTHLVDEDQWTERDRRVGQWYGALIMIGYAFAFGLIFSVSVPIMLTYLERSASGLLSDPWGGRFWDSVLSVAIIAFSVVLPILLARRKRRLNNGRRPRLLTENPEVM